MKNKRITITINKSPTEIYNFYINPKNTPLWIDSIVREETNEWPIRVGTIYRNQNRQGAWTEYVVTKLQPNEVFELRSKDSNYHVKYTHKVIDEITSELEYYEWVDKGELEEPFTFKILQKLKDVLEK